MEEKTQALIDRRLGKVEVDDRKEKVRIRATLTY